MDRHSVIVFFVRMRSDSSKNFCGPYCACRRTRFGGWEGGVRIRRCTAHRSSSELFNQSIDPLTAARRNGNNRNAERLRCGAFIDDQSSAFCKIDHIDCNDTWKSTSQCACSKLQIARKIICVKHQKRSIRSTVAHSSIKTIGAESAFGHLQH